MTGYPGRGKPAIKKAIQVGGSGKKFSGILRFARQQQDRLLQKFLKSGSAFAESGFRGFAESAQAII